MSVALAGEGSRCIAQRISGALGRPVALTTGWSGGLQACLQLLLGSTGLLGSSRRPRGGSWSCFSLFPCDHNTRV